jgi:hypothetical protein
VHMGTHTAKPRKAFTCTLGCGEVFTRQHDRHRHEVALHGKQCAHVCARCKRFFTTEKMLGRHVCRGYRQSGIQWPLGGTLTFSSCSKALTDDCVFVLQIMRGMVQTLHR